MIDKLNMQTPNYAEINIEKISGIFPNCLTEFIDENGNIKKAIDFDLLKQELSNNIVEGNKERYRLEWPGKKEALVAANNTLNRTLRPKIEDSINFDNTQNLYIEGDNLDALKLLQDNYLNKVKLIYIDPPYNTGKDFVYKDNFTVEKEELLEDSGLLDEYGNKLLKNQDSNGRYHSDWLSMIYTRLKVARNLLHKEGVIYISIDDNEVHNLRKICDEVFGEKNFIRNVIWEKKYSPANDSKVISDTHDHILVYAKNISEWTMKLLPRTEEMNKRYSNPDNDPRGPWKPGGLSAKTYSSKYDYPVVTPSGKTVYPPTGSCWQVSQEKLEMLISDNKIYFGKEGDAKPQIKQFLTDVQDGVVSKSIWKYDEVGHNQTSRKELTDLFDGEFLFDNPKPTTLIERIFDITTFAENDIVLDFFSGSGSTAHAVFKYNLKHNLNLHFILIQIPDRVTVNSVAEQKGYKNICEIGKERIRRAGTKILKENKDKEGIENLDIGFRVFKVDSSNMKDVYYNPDEIRQDNLFDMVSNIKEDRTVLDLLFQVLLDSGVELTLPIEEKQIVGKKVYFVDGNVLAACFEDNLTEEFVTELAKCEDLLKVVFRDSSFGSDDSRINVEQIFKQYSPDTQIRVI